MEYGIRGFGSEGAHFVPITQGEFSKAQESKEKIVKALGVEEKFNMILENYLEYERDLLDVTLREAVTFSADWSDMTDVVHKMNRRLVNLLSTCRLYLDQVPQDLSFMLGDDATAKEVFRTRRSEEYDSRLGYRAMEALRNYVQHRGLLVHVISFKGSWIEPDGDDERHRRHITMLKIDVERLEKDEKFKRAVLNELKKVGSQIDLKPLVREYVTGLMRVHQTLRDELELYLNRWDGSIFDLATKFRNQTESNASPLWAVARDSEGIIEEIPLLEDWISRRKELERKNRGFGDLLKLRISSL